MIWSYYKIMLSWYLRHPFSISVFEVRSLTRCPKKLYLECDFKCILAATLKKHLPPSFCNLQRLEPTLERRCKKQCYFSTECIWWCDGDIIKWQYDDDRTWCTGLNGTHIESTEPTNSPGQTWQQSPQLVWWVVINHPFITSSNSIGPIGPIVTITTLVYLIITNEVTL